MAEAEEGVARRLTRRRTGESAVCRSPRQQSRAAVCLFLSSWPSARRQVSLSRACLNDLDTFIKFQVWDLDHTNGHKLLGSIETSLREQQQFSEAAARKSKA